MQLWKVFGFVDLLIERKVIIDYDEVYKWRESEARVHIVTDALSKTRCPH